jgi:uncharacterized UBP type Zn finger protein
VLIFNFQPEPVSRTCEKCGCSDATGTRKFSAMPRVLILHVKRFSPSQDGSRYEKVHQKITPQMVLSLGELNLLLIF